MSPRHNPLAATASVCAHGTTELPASQPSSLSSPSSSSVSSLLQELYGDYFDAPQKQHKTVRFAEPLASYAPSASPELSSPPSSVGTAAIVHISQKLLDPTWLVPSRPAPKPPIALESQAASPAPPVGQNAAVMQREVLRIARLIEDEAEQITRAQDSQLQHHVQNSSQLGPKLERALNRLDRVARATDEQNIVAQTLPAVGAALCHHMRALLDASRNLNPLSLSSIVRYLRTETHDQALRLVVSDVPFSLPMAHKALDGCALDCHHAPTLRALSLVYRGLYAEAATLPPGGDSRLQFNMPNKIYTLEKTPGQLAQLWQAKANDLWMTSVAACNKHSG